MRSFAPSTALRRRAPAPIARPRARTNGARTWTNATLTLATVLLSAPLLASAAPSAMVSFAMAAAATAAPVTDLATDGHVALFKNATGNVRVERGGTTLPATSGMPLFIADRLVSGADGSAGLVFKDGTLLTLGPSAQLDVRDYAFDPPKARFAFSVYLAKGQAMYSSGKIGKIAPESVKVDTPSATVGVRGTRFIIDAE